jgi:hypothetical protein
MPEPAPTPPSAPPRVNPGVVAPAASALGSFNWPTPPFAAYPAGEPWSQPKPCEVLGLNGVSKACLLVALDPFDRIAHVQVPPSRVTMPLRFSQFQRILIDEPLAAQEAQADDPLMHHRPEVSYRLVLVDGSEEAGRTVGHIEVNYGLFLFKPINPQGSVQRQFLPRDAFLSIELGPGMTDVLLEQQVLSEQQLQQATQEHQALQNRKLGDLLVQQKMVSGDDLLLAVDQQSRMPMVRLGEALTALGLVSEQQMRAALSQQQSERNLSLGEVLISSGRISREALQLAQAQKLGFPAVDADSFPVDPRALERVPAAMARRLNALPLVLREGRLLVAVEDPMRRSVIEELELVANAKVAPVLAVGDRLARRITELYPELPLGPSAALGTPEAVAAPAQRATGPGSTSQGPIKLAQPLADTAIERELGRLLHQGLSAGQTALHLDCKGQTVAPLWRQDGVLVPAAAFKDVPSSRVLSALQALLPPPADGSKATTRFPVCTGWLDLSDWPELAVAGLGGVFATVCLEPSPHVVLQWVWPHQPTRLADLGLPEPVHQALSTALQQRRGLVLLASASEAAERRLRESCLLQLQHSQHPQAAGHMAAPVVAPTAGAPMGQRLVWTHGGGPAAPGTSASALPWSADTNSTAHAWQQLAAADADALVLADLCGAVQGGVLVQALLHIAQRHALVVLSLSASSAGQAIERLLDLGLSAHDLADVLRLVVVAQEVPGLCAACASPGIAQPSDLEVLDALLLQSLRLEEDQANEALRAAKAAWPRTDDGHVRVARCKKPANESSKASVNAGAAPCQPDPTGMGHVTESCESATVVTLYGMVRPQSAWLALVRAQADAKALDEAAAQGADSHALVTDGLAKSLRFGADPQAVWRALKAG